VAAALSDATTMRGGPALVGDASPDRLIARWTDGPTALLLVGEFQAVIVGVLGATVATRAGHGAPSGLVECCYVEAGARGVGVGTAMMDAAVEWCSAAGCGDVDALALPGDRATKQRLEAAGFVARLLTLSRRLD
jgi:GNAT superfamily N-acetyltransferase